MEALVEITPSMVMDARTALLFRQEQAIMLADAPTQPEAYRPWARWVYGALLRDSVWASDVNLSMTMDGTTDRAAAIQGLLRTMPVVRRISPFVLLDSLLAIRAEMGRAIWFPDICFLCGDYWPGAAYPRAHAGDPFCRAMDEDIPMEAHACLHCVAHAAPEYFEQFLLPNI